MTFASRPAALLWDMDGTLIDSEPYWMAAETELVTSFGGTWTHADALDLVGRDLETSARILRSRGVDLEPHAIVETLTDRVIERLSADIPWQPGASDVLSQARDAGVPCALVTMSLGRMARAVSEALGANRFDVVVAGDDVANGKPHPEPYQRAAALLGVDVSACVAFEDSEPGVASAVAAGCVTIAVPAHVALSPSPAYTLWPGGLRGRSFDDVSRHFAEVRRER